MYKWNLVLTLITTLSLFRCATTNKMRTAPLSAGVPRIFTADYNRVLKVAQEAVVEAGLMIEDVNQVNDKAWMIIGKKGASGWSVGELVRVVVEEMNDAKTIVRVYTKRRLATNITAKGDYSQSILSNIDLKLQ